MTSCKQGDIVLIPFPFTDLTTVKQRPAIVVSSDSFNKTRNDIIIAAITSQMPAQPAETDFIISNVELKKSGLLKPSVVKLGKVVTIDKRLVRRKLGSLSAASCKKIISQFISVFRS